MSGPNISNIGYLAFRLGPFIVVCSLVLQSILNWDLRGLIYLIGVVFTYIGNFLANKAYPLPMNDDANPKCGIISLGEKGSVYSSFPLSVAVYTYTFAYILTFILTRSTTGMIQNIPTMIVFPLLILMEIFWITSNKCTNIWHIIGTLIIGGMVGAFWAGFIIYLNKPTLMYAGSANMDVCSRPRKTYFSCKPA